MYVTERLNCDICTYFVDHSSMMVSLTPLSMLQNMLNDSSEDIALRPNGPNGRRDATGFVIQSQNVVSMTIGALGLPGNLLVFAVYVCGMTTSIRVYMFALAVVDVVVCMCGIGGILEDMGYNEYGVIKFSTNMSIAFSALIMAFVSIERLWAVRRPHKFTPRPLRAKIALVVLFVVSVATATAMAVARVNGYKQFRRLILVIMTALCVAVMTVCYSLLALTLLMSRRAAHRTVGVAFNAGLPGPSTVTTGMNVNTTKDLTSTQTNLVSIVKTTTANQAKTVKGLSPLLIVTIVFLVCWTPRWLAGVGFNLPRYTRGTMFLNSTVNPFIYSALSSLFRKDVRQFYRQIRVRLSTLHQ